VFSPARATTVRRRAATLALSLAWLCSHLALEHRQTSGMMVVYDNARVSSL
jgi:hypothetical protein